MPHYSSFTCRHCLKNCKSSRGLSRHRNSEHCQFTPAPEDEDENSFERRYHKLANTLPYGQDHDAWDPFGSQSAFAFAEFQFVELQASERNINTALDIWAASVHEFGRSAPWESAKELYAELITEDPATHGCAFVPVVAGSDKTTVSVATGHQEYHPVYISPGVLTGTARRARGNSVLPVTFLVIPKSEFSCLFLCTKTTTDALIMCFDPGILWDDYGIRSDVVPFTHDFPRADIHELIGSDLLHQVIKGSFKDHLITWVNEYLVLHHGEKHALEIIQDIDRHLSAVPDFPGLRRFPDGRDFQQWTGDDSKALMKAVAGYLPSDMMKALLAFMEFCYIVRHNTISAPDLITIKNALDRFHHYRQAFIDCGVCTDISLPCQHSLVHYIPSICLFASPNGLCSSITESKHIKAVKELWRRSSRYKALPRMLVTLTHLDKLAAARRDFTIRGMMTGTASSYTAMVLAGLQPQVEAVETAAALAAEKDDEEDDDGVRLTTIAEQGYPKYLVTLTDHVGHPTLPLLLRQFLYADDAALPLLNACPIFDGPITVHHSAIARFYAPSDLGGAGGMYRECIRSNPHWHGYARHDTLLVDAGGLVMGGIVAAHALLLLSFTFREQQYECALVHWITPVGVAPDPDTGMWVVELEYLGGAPSLQVINVDTIAR
ncbi:hypothetical protein B0H10DRAFT_2445344 [Mycena sp. CBHHK59/15]|nr:hypothetical protein B0H10DRAFT_2445344 [Mycena sp. CBHHK59/15]